MASQLRWLLVPAAFAAIVRLLFSRSPSTIARLIVAVIIWPAVDSKIYWAFTHICKEILEGFQPTVANFYSASAIIFVSCIARICAASQYVRPNMISPCTMIGTLAMCCVSLNSLSDCFLHSASATDGRTTTKRHTIDSFFCSTRTSAKPEKNPIFMMRRTHNCEPSKSFIGEINALVCISETPILTFHGNNYTRFLDR
jgi:hypothetical protein